MGIVSDAIKKRNEEEALRNRKDVRYHSALRKPIIESELPTLSAIEDNLIDRKLGRFIRHTWPLVEPGSKFLSNWHIDAIADHLEALGRGEIKRLIINIPPRCGKSLITGVFFPSWIWAQHPEYKFIYASHSASLATRDSVKMRRLIESQWYKDRYKPDPLWHTGDVEHYPGVVLERDQNAKSYYQNTATGQRLATSVGSGLTGEGADIIGVDDPHNAEEALTSEAARAHAISWWGGTLSTRLNPGSTVGAKFLIMQRLHEKDLVGHVLLQREKYFKAKEAAIREGLETGETSETAIDEDDIDWQHLCLPAEYMPKHPLPSRTKLQFKDPRTKTGDSIWPAGLSRGKIAALRVELGSYAASGQLDQLPSPAGGGMFRGEWFRKLTKQEWPTFFEQYIQSWDLSYSDDPSADYSVGFLLGAVGKKVYVCKRISGQMHFTGQLTAIRALSTLEPLARAKYVEKAANARALQNTLESEIPGIILTPTFGSKVTKAAAWTPYLEAGNIFFPDFEPWTNDVISEHEKFPNGANDDNIDALGIGVMQLLKNPSYNIAVDTEAQKSNWKDM